MAREEVEARTLQAMEDRLWNHQRFEDLYVDFTRERNRLLGEATAAANDAARDLAAIERRAGALVDWICTGE